jgi:hypothetical protein
MKRIVLLPLTCALIVACQEQRSPTGVKPPSALLMDGAHNAGNAHLFFLPPLVKQPSVSGVFNPALKPVVVICQLDVGPPPLNTPTGCSPGVAPIDPGPVTADLAGQQYKVNWDTRQSGISVDKFYRIQVFGSSNGLLLGFADVDPVNNGSGLKNVNTNEYIGLVDGRTLPIKFRIERGAFGTNCTSDCAEANVSNAGGIVVTNTGFAGASFPSGWLPAPFTNVVVTIERVNVAALGASCIPLNQQQAEGCYRFKTIPDVGNFAGETPVTVGICVDIEHIAQHDAAQLFKVEEFIGEGGGISLGQVTALENAPATFVSCAGFASAAPAPGLFADMARAVRRVGTWLAPSSAYAAHVGVGGLTGSFSRIGWMLPTSIDFDFAPGEGGPESVRSGDPVTTRYSSLGVTFAAITGGREGCSGGTDVFANNSAGSLSTNAVSLCQEGPAGFSEVNDGVVRADLPRSSKVCIQVTPTDGASTGFLELWDGEGGASHRVTSAPGVAQVLCIESAGPAASGIFRVQFAGTGSVSAIFDNLSFTAAPFSD